MRERKTTLELGEGRAKEPPFFYGLRWARRVGRLSTASSNYSAKLYTRGEINLPQRKMRGEEELRGGHDRGRGDVGGFFFGASV